MALLAVLVVGAVAPAPAVGAERVDAALADRAQPRPRARAVRRRRPALADARAHRARDRDRAGAADRGRGRPRDRRGAAGGDARAAPRPSARRSCGSQRRLAEGRDLLAAQLVADYKADRPDIVSLVLGADNFADLLERVELAKRRAGAQRPRSSPACTRRATRPTGTGDRARRARGRAAARPPRRSQRAPRRAGQHARRPRAAPGHARRARAARAQALAGTRAGRPRPSSALDKLIAEREAAAGGDVAARAARGRSRGRSCSASPAARTSRPTAPARRATTRCCPSTWRGLGGSTPHAYQASKAEQDRLAAKLWAGGAGARNWVCAGLV